MVLDKCQGGTSCSSHYILVGRLGSDEVAGGAMYKRGSFLNITQEKPVQMGSQTYSLIPCVATDLDLPTMIC